MEMQNRGLTSLLDYLRRELPPPGQAVISDGELLSRFARSDDHAAFELLVRRHGPLVFGVAKRILHDEHMAEDVLQATFLALARQAKSLRRQQSIVSWLHRVAVRLSGRMKTRPIRRGSIQVMPIDPADAVEHVELRESLDDAIDRLPDKLRRTVMHCYVLGHTTEEAARLLDCPKGTVLSRLAAAREKLQTELTRKGIVVSAAALTSALTTEMTSAALPSTLVAIAMKAIGPAAALTPIVITLAQGVVAMSWMKVTMASIILLTAGFGIVFGLAFPQSPQAKSKADDIPNSNPASLKKADDQPPRIKELADFQNTAKEVWKYRNDARDELTKAMVQRLQSAQRELELRMQEFVAGRGTFHVLLDCAGRANNSAMELVLDKNKEKRILIEHYVLMKYIEKVCEDRFNAGAIKQQDLEQARYAQLDALARLRRVAPE